MWVKSGENLRSLKIVLNEISNFSNLIFIFSKNKTNLGAAVNSLENIYKDLYAIIRKCIDENAQAYISG